MSRRVSQCIANRAKIAIWGLVVSLVCSACSTTKRCTVEPYIIEAASTFRNLPLSGEVECRLETRKDVRRFVRDEIKRATPPSRIKYESEVYRILGLIPAEYDLVAGLTKLYSERLAAYYDPGSGQFVKVAGTPGEVADVTVVHELTHVIQDRHFDVRKILTKELTNDELLARTSLFEGDAVVVESKFLKTLDCTRYSPDAIVENLQMRLKEDKSVPPAVMLMMSFPYVYGPRYVCGLLDRGGYELLNETFTAPPPSTRAVMHLDLSSTSGREHISAYSEELEDREVLFTDRLGEFGLLSLLATYLPLKQARIVASGWTDDRFWYFDPSREYPAELEWRISCKDETAAKTLESFLTSAYRKRFPGAWKRAEDGVAFEETRYGNFSLTRRGIEVVLTVE